MEYVIDLLKGNNITDIIANTHYLPIVITDYFKDVHAFGVNINYSYENKLLGTAGGVKNNQWFLQDEAFIILSGR